MSEITWGDLTAKQREVMILFPLLEAENLVSFARAARVAGVGDLPKLLNKGLIAEVRDEMNLLYAYRITAAGRALVTAQQPAASETKSSVEDRGMSDFKLGDRVRVKETALSEHAAGEIGSVFEIGGRVSNDDAYAYYVEFADFMVEGYDEGDLELAQPAASEPAATTGVLFKDTVAYWQEIAAANLKLASDNGDTIGNLQAELAALRERLENLSTLATLVIEDCKSVGVIPIHLGQLEQKIADGLQAASTGDGNGGE